MPGPTNPDFAYVPRSFPRFFIAFGTEERCIAHVFHARYPQGYRCDRCDSRAFRIVRRVLTVCRSCRAKSSLLKGTVLENTKLPLKLWFRAIHLFRRSQCTAELLVRGLPLGSSPAPADGSPRKASPEVSRRVRVSRQPPTSEAVGPVRRAADLGALDTRVDVPAIDRVARTRRAPSVARDR